MIKINQNFEHSLRVFWGILTQVLKLPIDHWPGKTPRSAADKEIFARNKGLLETNIFCDCKVVIVGGGTLGAPIALDLARCGVGKFVIIDPDQLDIANISRHPSGYHRNVGRFKVDIISENIGDINPEATVQRYRLKVDWDTSEKTLATIKKADIVILTADSYSVKSVINKLCLEENIPFLWSGCYRRAYGGQILKVVPRKTACYECFRENLPDDDEHEISSERSANAPAYSDIEVKAEPGLGVDILPIATMTSKLAIQMLLNGKESSLHSLDEDLDCNFYMYFNRREGKAEGFIPMSDYIDGLRILSWIGVKIPCHDDCICCGEPALDTVLDTNSEQMVFLRKQCGLIRNRKNA